MADQKILLAIIIIGLISCAQSTAGTHATTVDISKSVQSDKELWTLYSKSDTVCHVKRLISSDSNYVLLTYDIEIGPFEAVNQSLIEKDTVKKKDLERIRSQSAGFNWKPFTATPILFVQLQATAFKDEMAALYKGHQVEQIIDADLKSRNLGSWIAGDVGPGGANMLF
jgi:hypothetical protein